MSESGDPAALGSEVVAHSDKTGVDKGGSGPSAPESAVVEISHDGVLDGLFLKESRRHEDFNGALRSLGQLHRVMLSPWVIFLQNA